MSEFNFNIAQKHELEWQAKYIRTVLPPFYKEWKENKDKPILTSWFTDGEDIFLSHINGKSGMDIGCGSIPALRASHGLSRRIVVDPLADEYRKIQEAEFGGSFFEGLTIEPKPAEEKLSQYVNAIDGVIIFRNAMDHSEDPLRILFNISIYAMRGCYLLFWSDLWHNLGTDSGHKNITRCPDAIYALLNGLGFRQVRGIGSQHNDDTHIEYGGIFIKE